MDINLLFLIELDNALQSESDISIQSFFDSFRKKHPHFEIFNPRFISMLLFAQIVMPWESLKHRLPKKIMLSDLDFEQWGYFKVLNHNPKHSIHKLDLRFFIRKLRNSISHNNFRINKDKSVTFRDKDNTKIKYEWEELIRLFSQLNSL